MDNIACVIRNIDANIDYKVWNKVWKCVDNNQVNNVNIIIENNLKLEIKTI